MTMNTRKKVGTRTPPSINVELDTLPKNESDALCRSILGAMARVFEDPAVVADYQNWKKQRQSQNREKGA